MILGLILGISLIILMAYFGICATNEIIEMNNYQYKDNCYCDKCKDYRHFNNLRPKINKPIQLEVE